MIKSGRRTAIFGVVRCGLGNTILVKLELWESVMVIIIFGLPLTYAYATLRQSVAGNLTFRGIVFCNLGTPKTVISNFVTSRQIETPYISPYGYPNGVPGGQKMVEETKNDEHTNVLIPWYPVSYLTIASSGFFFFGRLRVPTRRCDLVVPADGGWGRSN
jgi:short subunit fatty acids transporter